MSGTAVLMDRWPVLARHERAAAWLGVWASLGWAPRTIDAYARGLAEYLAVCDREGVDPVAVNRAHVAGYLRELATRPGRRGANVAQTGARSGLAGATIRQRLVPVRLFYDFLVEEGWRDSNPIGRGCHIPDSWPAGVKRGPARSEPPWIPSDQQWLRILDVAGREPMRNRVMLTLAYEAALRREELCSLRIEDVDVAHRVLRVRAETTRNRLERTVAYSAPTGALLADYLTRWRGFGPDRGPLFPPESRRDHTHPLSPCAWSKVIRRIALAAGVERFTTHTARHLRLAELARRGWGARAIAAFAGYRHPGSALPYVHLSGRESAAMDGQHARPWRVQARPGAGEDTQARAWNHPPRHADRFAP